jgi:hypothetical protein
MAHAQEAGPVAEHDSVVRREEAVGNIFDDVALHHRAVVEELRHDCCIVRRHRLLEGREDFLAGDECEVQLDGRLHKPAPLSKRVDVVCPRPEPHPLKPCFDSWDFSRIAAPNDHEDEREILEHVIPNSSNAVQHNLPTAQKGSKTEGERLQQSSPHIAKEGIVVIITANKTQTNNKKHNDATLRARTWDGPAGISYTSPSIPSGMP